MDGAPSAAFGESLNLDTLTVTNNSSGANTYLWDFGDGSTDDAANPAPHVYAQDGTYTVMLIATNDCGSDTSTTTITVVTPPTAGFSADATSGCAPFTVQFTDESSENTTAWSWTFEGGDPATSNDPNPTVTYLNPGTYGVTLTVSNSAGSDQLVQEDFINVGIAPTADFTYNINNSSVQFNADTANASYLSWDFGDGSTSTETNPLHTYAEDGSYLVVLTVGNECGEVMVQETLLIATQAPIALFEADMQIGCAPLEVQFTNLSSENAESFEWHFPGGDPEFSMLENPVVTYEQPGAYDVSLIASNANGSDTLTFDAYIIVNEAAQSDFSYAMNGATVSFFNMSQDADSYFWDFGDGSSSTEENPVHTYAGGDTYTVILFAANECGETTDTAEITIELMLPVANFTADTTIGCAPLEVQFTDMSTGNPTSWSWEFEGGDPATSDLQNPEVSFNSPGTYTVSLMVSNADGSNMLVQTDYITVLDLPQADFTYVQNGLEVSFEGPASNVSSYAWDFGDGSTSTLNNPVHTYAEAGEYTVTLTVSNACGEADSQQILMLVTATTEQDFQQAWLLYPNPNDGQFTLQYEGEPIVFDVQVFDMLGREVKAFRQMQTGNGKWSRIFDLRKKLSAGTYLVKVSAEKQTVHFVITVN